jgi:hypothetical protein
MLAIWLAADRIADIIDHRLDALPRPFAYAVLVHQTKYLIEIGFPLLVIELGVAAMGAGLLLGSPISDTWLLYLTLSAPGGGGVNCLAYTGSHAPADVLLVRCSGSPATPELTATAFGACADSAGLLVAIPCGKPRWTRCAAENPSATRRKHPGSN